MERKTFIITPSSRPFIAKAAVEYPEGWQVRFTPAPRTGAQNSGTHVLYEIIANVLRDDDASGWKCYCKLHHGVPILRAEDPQFREAYDAAIKPLPYERKLSIMRYWPVTSLMDKDQVSRYIAALQADFEPRGVRLELRAAA